MTGLLAARCPRGRSSPLILEGGGFWPPFAVAFAGGTALTALLSFLSTPAALRWPARRRPFGAREEPRNIGLLPVPPRGAAAGLEASPRRRSA